MKTLVWNKFWWHEREERGVSRVFDTLAEAEEWARNNVGNWQFEPFFDKQEEKDLAKREVELWNVMIAGLKH